MYKETLYIIGSYIQTHRSENLGHKGENVSDFPGHALRRKHRFRQALIRSY